MLQRSGDTTCSRITITENVVIPPECEMIVPSKLSEPVNNTIGVIEPFSKFVTKSGLMVAKTLVDVKEGKIPIRVANLGFDSRTVYRGTIAALYESINEPDINCLDKVMVNNVSVAKSLPDHLTSVFARAQEKLSDEQRCRLEQLLTRYQATFSNDDDNIGCTQLVKHTIDTGN